MKVRKRSYIFWCGLVVVFLLALLPRTFYPASRYMLWYERSVYFWNAFLAGDFGHTYQRDHPGVTVMWIAGLGLRIYMMMQGWSSHDLLNPPSTMAGPQGPPAQAAVIALGLVIAACIALVYVLLARLINWPTAFSAGCLLALDPFYITHSKMIHVDALLASFMLISALCLIGYLKEKRKRYLALGGVFAGLAFLTKSPALFLIPYAALTVTSYHLLETGSARGDFSTIRFWCKHAWKVARSLVAWGLVAICVFFVLWPAMWVEPMQMFYRIGWRALYHIETQHPAPTFFAGRITSEPGPLYYLATLAWKTTLITLPAILASVLFLMKWKREEKREILYVLVYAGCFVLAMTLAAKKWSRYILPAFVALDVLAAWGLVQAANAIGQWGRFKRAWIPTIIITIALLTQAVVVLGYHPYYGAHHNLLLGGSTVAQHILHLGDQGEGLDLAARFLNSRPGAERLKVAVVDPRNQMFRDNFVGHVYSDSHPDVDYRVFSIHYAQRNAGSDTWKSLREDCLRQGPFWSVSLGGVPYVWICRAYPHDPEMLAIEHRQETQLGEHIRFLGYELSSNSISAGDTLTVTLFWQSDGQLVEDYHVFVHLLDADEQTLIAQHDGVPVQGTRPTWGWQSDEVLQDEHVLVTDASLPSGTYTLSVGMYDYLTQDRLPPVGSDGKRLPDDRVILQDIQVRSP